MRIYLPHDVWQPGEFAAFLAIGDSWFWYPKNNVLQALIENPQLKPDYANIQMLGYNGAKLEEFVFGKYADDLAHELQPRNRHYYSAILISGAGNDAVDYRLGLFKNCSGANSSDQCINNEAMAALLGKLATALGALIDQVRRAYAADGSQPPIFLHSYDYPIPDGRGFNLAALKITGPWLASAMDDCFVPPDPELRKDICRHLIDSLHDEFAQIAASADGIYLIDSRGCLQAPDYRDDWDNELHPSPRGFRRIIAERWIPVLKDRGFAG